MSFDEDLHMLEVKLKQLKLDYEQYFMGSRPREPVVARSEIQKAVIQYSSQPIKNTALRFRFNSINSRFQAWKRQWDNINRQIERGTYERHVFKANLHARERKGAPLAVERGGTRGSDLFETYRDAALACGQDVKNLTPARLDSVIRKQEKALREKLGCEQVSFRVVVEKGKVRLKASAQR